MFVRVDVDDATAPAIRPFQSPSNGRRINLRAYRPTGLIVFVRHRRVFGGKQQRFMSCCREAYTDKAYTLPSMFMWPSQVTANFFKQFCRNFEVIGQATALK